MQKVHSWCTLLKKKPQPIEQVEQVTIICYINN